VLKTRTCDQYTYTHHVGEDGPINSAETRWACTPSSTGFIRVFKCESNTYRISYRYIDTNNLHIPG
jgi:hypothetical protein